MVGNPLDNAKKWLLENSGSSLSADRAPFNQNRSHLLYNQNIPHGSMRLIEFFIRGVQYNYDLVEIK